MKSLKLDPNFKPIILELKKFNQDVLNYGKSNKITIAVRRQQGYVHSKTIDVFPDGVNDQRNILIVERYIKSVLWICGGYEIYISGSKIIYDAIKSYYSLGGLRDFDMKFFFDVYDKYIEVFYVEEKDLPKNKEASLTIGGFLEGKRVGFDAGGSDRKSSAVVN